MTKLTFEHIHLLTPDPEATAAWYERMFGAQIVRSMPDGNPRTDIKLGGMDIFVSLIDPKNVGIGAPPKTPHQGLDHFGLRVDHLDVMVADLKSKGVEFTRGPIDVRPGLRIAFLRAPEGVSIELLERK